MVYDQHLKLYYDIERAVEEGLKRVIDYKIGTENGTIAPANNNRLHHEMLRLADNPLETAETLRQSEIFSRGLESRL